MQASRLTAALAVLCATPFVAGGCAQAPLAHTCSLTDKQFIQTTRLDMDALGYWSQGLATGDSTASDVIAETKDAAARVGATRPTDPTLAQTRVLLGSMLSEYWRAVSAQAHHREAGPHMLRAYGLANFAHDVLQKAEPALASRGCDVAPLL